MDMSQVSVQNCSSGGIDFRDGATANISSSTVKNCRIGMKFEEGAKVSQIVFIHLYGYCPQQATLLLQSSVQNQIYHVALLVCILCMNFFVRMAKYLRAPICQDLQ